MTRRNEILRAVAEAATVLADTQIDSRTSFDIIGAVTSRGIPLMFRPLDKLLGAFITASNGTRGILVTTNRGLSVQRFTLAHELGHALLQHEQSFDRTIEFAGRHSSSARPAWEVAADTFAAELLAPKSLLLASAQRHGWTRHRLRQPPCIYQLALRLGISYEAACWALTACQVLGSTEAANLRNVPVKGMKRDLAPESLITDSWADVWLLTAADSGTSLEAGPNDLFAVHVRDHASSGYVWRLVDANSEAEIVGERPPNLEQAYGGRSERVLYVRFRGSGTHRLVFEHMRPWSRETLECIEIEIDNYGKEREGWARRARFDALEKAA